MKHVLYIGQAFDPLEQIFVENRKKVGIRKSRGILRLWKKKKHIH